MWPAPCLPPPSPSSCSPRSLLSLTFSHSLLLAFPSTFTHYILQIYMRRHITWKLILRIKRWQPGWKFNILIWDINGERSAIIGKIPKLIQLPTEAWVRMSPKTQRIIYSAQHKVRRASSEWGKGRHFHLPGKSTSSPCCILSRSQTLVLSKPAGILPFTSPVKSWVWSHFPGNRFLKQIFKLKSLLPWGSGWQNQSFVYLINTLKTIYLLFHGFLKHIYPAALDSIQIIFLY